MKKGKILFYFSIICLMFLSITNVYAADNVKIKSVELIDKSINTTETGKATFNGLEMNFNIRFLSVDDYAKYKVVVENKESKDYEISVDSEFNDSKYITYEYEKADNIKANSESEFYVTVTYKNEVDESNFTDEKYTEKNSAVLKLSNDNISNPQTSNNEVMIIIGLIVISGVLFVLFRNNKTRNISVFVLLGILSIPLFVKAVEQLKLTVNSNVVIEKGYHVDYGFDAYIKASDNYDLSQADCSMTIYDTSVSEENKYFLCNGVIYKNEKLYTFGESVKIDLSPINIYYFKYDSCNIIGNDDNGNDIKICESPEIISETYSFDYDIDDIIKYGYGYNDDDNVVMNFSDASDFWKEQGKIRGIYHDSTFTMPKHDVLFTSRAI